MAYGTTKVDVIQSSTANVPVQFNDGNGTQIGTLCRAWVNFNGTGTVAIRASFNVSSITDNGTGDYTVNFTNAMPDVNYSVVGTINCNYGSNRTSTLTVATDSAANEAAPSTTAIRVCASAANAQFDAKYVDISIFR